MNSYQGTGISAGFALAPAVVWRKALLRIDPRQKAQRPAEEERIRLADALAQTAEELSGLRSQLEGQLGEGHAAILDAQMLLLEDEDFLEKVHAHIAADGLSAEAAFARALGEALIPLDLSGDEFFRERMLDLRDVEQRVLRKLGGDSLGMPTLQDECILVSPSLSPSETAALDLEKIAAFVLDEGSATSHTAIIARSLGIPLVVGVKRLSQRLSEGDLLAVDGQSGIVVREPDEVQRERFATRQKRRRATLAALAARTDEPSVTLDGHRIQLLANVELPLEMKLALQHGAEGIGLLRTEFFYFRHAELPGEEEQYREYRTLLEAAGEAPVTFRVLDVGGDKFLAAQGGYRDSNPFLGWRGVRFLLGNLPVLRTQLRALYRAGAHGDMRILFPMISGVDELLRVREECAGVRNQLLAEGHELGEELPLGIMIETPSAVSMAPELARHCDFFSIGSNDLTQYLLAVDRSSKRVAYLYRPEHPAVLRAIAATIAAAKEAKIELSLCGEMASQPLHAVLLMGLGLKNLSLNASALPTIREVVRRIRLEEAEQWAQHALKLDSPDAVDHYLRRCAYGRLREFLAREA